ncbi:hypothetical protein LguiB_030956 [Lonicera macranthoides]
MPIFGLGECIIDYRLQVFLRGEIFYSGKELSKKVLPRKFLATGIPVPGIRHLATKGNREQWTLEKEIQKLILQLGREKTEAGYEKDLLQMVLEKNSNLSFDTIDHFDNYKKIYLAGYMTTAVSAT